MPFQKHSNSKDDLGKGQYSNQHSSPYNEYQQGPYVYYGDDSEAEDGESSTSHQKQVSSSRFYRNNLLIAELFNDKMMPEIKGNPNRFETLRRQTEALTVHHTRSEGELNSLRDKFEEKKRQLVESSEEFNRQMEKLSQPVVTDPETFQKMVDTALQEIKVQHEEQKNRPKETPPASQPPPPPIELPPVPVTSNGARQPSPPLQSQANHSSSQQQPLTPFPGNKPAAAPYLSAPAPRNHPNAGAFSQATVSRSQAPAHSPCNTNQSSSGSLSGAHPYGDPNAGSTGSLSGPAAKLGPAQQPQYASNHVSFSQNHRGANQASQLHASQAPPQHTNHQPPHASAPYPTPNAATPHHSHPNRNLNFTKVRFN